MFKAIKSPYLVPFNESFDYLKAATKPPSGTPDKKTRKEQLHACIQELDQLQRIFYAHNQFSVLLIFQAMDAAGKDSTIRAVFSGVNPAGCQIFEFKRPTPEELDHDFLWRTSLKLPERGRIGIFNRSYYEEVLVARVHPELLKPQKLPWPVNPKTIWEERFESIRDHEKHLARNGTIILKFWLNLSQEEQKKRFLSRIDEPTKNWKFEKADLYERRFWKDYMGAYNDVLNATSRPWAPWYAIPANSKSYMRLCVAEVLINTLKSLKLKYPELTKNERAHLADFRKALEEE